MEVGILVGRLISLIIFPLIIMGAVGLVQYFRTGDKELARKSMFSGKTIAFSLFVLVLGIIGQIKV